ncbi:MAG: hypothetical protein ABI539_07040 [Acidobacteriota bacterium]
MTFLKFARHTIVPGLSIISGLIFIIFQGGAAYSQSTIQEFPTPVLANEIAGVINARDIGDSRLTTYYYTLDAGQGDLFVNIVTRNFAGDIDLFIVEGLKPLTKVVVFADTSENETGRVVYFRTAEHILLRIQGRTPGDDPASFRIKFAGSFEPSRSTAQAPEIPKVAGLNESNSRVNSVGTIVKVIRPPEKTPDVKAVTAAVKTKEDEKADELPDAIPADERTNVEPVKEKQRDENPEARPNAVVTDKLPPAKEADTAAAKSPKTTPPRKTTKKSRQSESEASSPAKAAAPDPLAAIKLIILFKDGSRIERQMNEVLKFGVDKGILTVISKDGTIGRYSILDVLKLSVE